MEIVGAGTAILSLSESNLQVKMKILSVNADAFMQNVNWRVLGFIKLLAAG